MNPRGQASRLVGRESELAILADRLDAAGREPATVLISGQAGIGKSRLARTAVEAAASPATFVGAAPDATEESAPAFALLRDAVADAVADWDGPPTPLAPRAEALARILDPVVVWDHLRTDRQLDDETLLRAAGDLVAHLSEPGAVWFFDDLHCADAATLRLLGRLARHPPVPVLVIGCYRPEDTSRRRFLSGLLAELQQVPGSIHLRLSSLRPDEVSTLVTELTGRAPNPREAHELHLRTQGNPFFVEEIASHTEEPGRFPAALPRDVTEAALRRLDALSSEPAAGVVRAAAVLGSRFRFELLRAVTGIDEAALEAALREAVDAGIVAEHRPNLFAFRHALTREAVAGSLLARERRRVHERALEALQAEGDADPDELAHHAEGAGLDTQAAGFALRAAIRALRGGSALEGLRLAERALALRADEDPRTLKIAAQAAHHSGMPDLARDYIERLRRCARRSGDVLDLAWADRRLAYLARWCGDGVAARRHIDAALARVESLGPSAELAWCHAARAEDALQRGAASEAITSGETALGLAEIVGEGTIRAPALISMGGALDLAGRPQQALDVLRGARALAGDRGQTDWELRSILHMFNVLMRSAPLEDADTLLAEAHRIVEDHGSGSEDFWRIGRARLHLRAGDVDAAAAALEAVLEGDVLFPEAQAFARCDLAGVRYEQGRPAEGRAVLGPVLAGSRRRRQPAIDLPAEAAATLLAAASGDTDAVWAHLERWEALAGRADGAYPLAPIVVDLLDGGWDAEALREVWRRASDRHRHSGDAGWPPHVEAAFADAASDADAAVTAYRRSIEADEGYRSAVFLASAHFGLARSLFARGDEDAAVDPAETAAALLQRARGWRRQRAEALRRRLAGTSVRGDGQALSPREREVAALVAEGLTNTEIARRLYIAPKTASAHVSHILSKLRVRTRAEVAAWAVGAEIADAPPSPD